MLIADQAKRLDARLSGVREKFLASLRERLAVIEAATPPGASSRISPEACDQLRDAAHKIAGLAPSLGFEYLGELAARVEDATWSADDCPGWPSVKQDVDELVREAQRLLEDG